MYSSHMQPSPHFSNPWTSHETHSTSAYPPLPKSDITRPSAMSMSYPQMAVSAPMSSGSSYSNLGYGGSDLLSGTQDIPEQRTTIHTLHRRRPPRIPLPPQHIRKLVTLNLFINSSSNNSEKDQASMLLLFKCCCFLLMLHSEMIIRAQQMPASESSMHLEVCWL